MAIVGLVRSASIDKGMEVTTRMRRNRVLAAMAAIIVVIFGYAWIDGGREPVRDISVPVAIPDLPR